jgi:hypothetical protein
MILFAVVCGGHAVGLRGEIVKLGCSLMRIFWHTISPNPL